MTVINKFDTIQQTFESHTLNDEYENFVTTHNEAAHECEPIKSSNNCRVIWESLAAMEKWDNMKKASLLNKETQKMPMHRNFRKPRGN